MLSHWAFGLAAYKIEECRVPLSQMVNFKKAPILTLVGGLLSQFHHVFVRGETALNFEPKNTSRILGSTAVVRTRDFANAECRTVFESENRETYLAKWQIVENYFRDEAKNTSYHILGLEKGKNCQQVATEAIEAAGLSSKFVGNTNNVTSLFN
jgi:hypothetical protein